MTLSPLVFQPAKFPSQNPIDTILTNKIAEFVSEVSNHKHDNILKFGTKNDYEIIKNLLCITENWLSPIMLKRYAIKIEIISKYLSLNYKRKIINYVQIFNKISDLNIGLYINE